MLLLLPVCLYPHKKKHIHKKYILYEVFVVLRAVRTTRLEHLQLNFSLLIWVRQLRIRWLGFLPLHGQGERKSKHAPSLAAQGMDPTTTMHPPSVRGKFLLWRRHQRYQSNPYARSFSHRILSPTLGEPAAPVVRGSRCGSPTREICTVSRHTRTRRTPMYVAYKMKRQAWAAHALRMEQTREVRALAGLPPMRRPMPYLTSPSPTPRKST